MKIDEVRRQYQLFVDMDGVLVDFDAGLPKLDLTPKEHTNAQYWKAIDRYQAQGGKFWLELPIMKDAMYLWNYVSPYKPQILTAVGDNKYDAAQQKRQWIEEHIGPNIKVNTSPSAAKKASYAGPNKILIDDRPRAINPWKEAGGIGILHTSASKTIEDLRLLGL